MTNSPLAIITALGLIGILSWALARRRPGEREPLSTPVAPPLLSDPAPVEKLSPQESAAVEQQPLAYAFVDLETTGLDSETDRITEICVFIVTPGAESHDGRSTLVNPGRPLTPFITELTGITDEMLQNERGEEKLNEYFDFIGDRAVYAYNAEFDMSFLRAAARRLGRSFENSSRCIMQRVKDKHPNLRSYKLTDVCEAFGVEIDGAPHRAQGDAKRAIFLLSAVNSGKQPEPSAIRPDTSAPEYGVFGHYRRDGVIFYVWTARNGEPTVPKRDSLWSRYVETELHGQYEIRCLRGGLNLDQALDVKQQLLGEHAAALLNRLNPYRPVIFENSTRYERLKAACWEHRNKAKELESSNPEAAIEQYKDALPKLTEYGALVLEAGLYGELMHDRNQQAYGREALNLLDRLSLLLCRLKRHDEASSLAEQIFQQYPDIVGTKEARVIANRISKALVRVRAS